MQHPVTRSKVTAPKPAAQTEEVTHVFTKTEFETLQPVLQQAQSLQDKLSLFLTHLVKEHKLPMVPGGYNLTPDELGLIGHKPKE